MTAHPDGRGDSHGGPLKGRDATRYDREWIANAALLASLPVLAIAANLAGQIYLVTLATKIAILGLAAVGLNVALGYGGLVSFGHAAFFGTGGYVAGILAHHALNAEPLINWPIVVGGTTQMLVIWPVALVIGGLLALAIGTLSLRSTGVYFIMITLAFAQMIYYVAISWPTYGGEDGLPIAVRNVLPWLDTLNPLTFFAVCFALLIAVIGAVSLLVSSSFGLALSCARQNEARLSAAGIAPFPVRLTAFAISGAIAALAGALFADLNRFVSPTMLSWHTSGELIVFVILGGTARLCGPLAGAALFVILEQLLGGITEYWKALFGLILLAVVLYGRGGLMHAIAGARKHG